MSMETTTDIERRICLLENRLHLDPDYTGKIRRSINLLRAELAEAKEKEVKVYRDHSQPCEHVVPEGTFGAVKTRRGWLCDDTTTACPGGAEVRLEEAWECLVPEFADEKCLYDHDPAATLMPRKHDGCGWNLWREVPDE